MASVSVEGRGSLGNVDGVLDHSQEPLLPHLDLGVIKCVAKTVERGVFRNVRVEVFSICVFSKPGAQNSGCLTNVFLVTLTTRNTLYHPTLVCGKRVRCGV